MKTLLLTALFALAPLAFADVKTEVLKDVAVRGAVAHMKRFSGGKSCLVHDVKIDKGQFDLYISCTNPGDPKESARLGYGTESSGQVHVTGWWSEGVLMLEKIDFAYAG